MGCFSNMFNNDNMWWIIILVLIMFAGDSCIFDTIRRYLCGENMIWILALLLLCNGGGSGCGCSDPCQQTCQPANPCGCC